MIDRKRQLRNDIQVRAEAIRWWLRPKPFGGGRKADGNTVRVLQAANDRDRAELAAIVNAIDAARNP